MGNFIDLTGQRFGRLTVMNREGSSRDGGSLWMCSCDCGKQKIIRGSSLLSGRSLSCGCLNEERLQAINIRRFQERQERLAREAAEMAKWMPVDKTRFNDDWMFGNVTSKEMFV